MSRHKTRSNFFVWPSCCRGWLLAVLAILVTTSASAYASDGPRYIEAMFLGDTGHHQPLARAQQLVPVLLDHGIRVTYTEDADDLNADNLSHYDCLIIYANIDTITPDQEKALLDFVNSGKGLAALHCASYCFRNSQAYVDLVGAQFQSHGTGVFRTRIVAPDHPIMRGLKSFESWDETYVHHLHNDKGRTILSYRDKEPWTWVRTQGKGRVFYTAWGHDERTWSNPGFRKLVERGVRWVCGDWAMNLPRPTLQPYSYASARIPNYVPSTKWGEQGKPINEMQNPLRPHESMKHMLYPAGFDLKLFAAEPDIRKPICMAWDERGRCWIAETVDYPNDRQAPGEGHDAMKICEDTDGDGVADKFTVFADKLSLPTSIAFANGGIVVHQPPDTLFLKDTDGDDVADVRKVLFTGWGISDTHAGPSNLRYGLDNWLGGTVGYSAFDGEVGGVKHQFRQGIYRFKPDGSAMEFLASTSNNTWGLGMSEDGRVFGSTANGNPSVYLAIANRYYERVHGWSPQVLPMISDSARFLPQTQRVRQVDWHGQYTAGAGHALYTARAYPQRYWNDTAFVNEPTGHLVGTFRIDPDGAGYKSHNLSNLLAGTDEWIAPIFSDVGPDGQMWIIDWYNFIVQHNPVPEGFKVGKGNAYQTDLRDKRHGRIYRLVYQDSPGQTVPDLHHASPETLVKTLRNPTMLWRLHAQRLLVERGKRDVVPQLIAMARDENVDEIGLNVGVIHALWTLQGLGVLDGSNPDAFDAARDALKHKSAAVRRNALMVLPHNELSRQAILNAGLLNDPEAHVRLAALLALADAPGSDAVGAAVFAMTRRPDDVDDRLLQDAATAAAANSDVGFLEAAITHAESHKSNQSEVAKNLIENPGFENESDGKPIGWNVRHYRGEAEQHYTNEGRDGSRCLVIESAAGADTSWFTNVRVKPNATYRLSAWIKSENVENNGGLGALLNVHEIQSPQRAMTQAITGTHDWQPVEVVFDTGDRETISINCLFGGWGLSTGKAWFDDVSLVEVGQALPPIVRTVTMHYASRGPTDSIVSLLSSLSGASGELSGAILSGLAAGWPDDVKPDLSAGDRAALSLLMRSLDADHKDHLLALASKWGQRELFADDITAIRKMLVATLSDENAPDARRADAARRLIGVRDDPATLATILNLVTPTAPPTLASALIDAVGASRLDDAGAALLDRYTGWTPAAQRAALNMLLRRPVWTRALLDRIDAGKINQKDLIAEQWQTLTHHPDKAIAQHAEKLRQSSGRAPSPDRQKVIDKLIHVADGSGDAAAGKLVFEKNCARCHTFAGEGGVVGPDLTGIGARPKRDLLIDILDPNRSVEGTYRQWTIQTADWELISGRLTVETRKAVEVLDSNGERHVVQRDNIETIEASPMSVMPEGFELLPEADLANLLEYLQSAEHAKK